MSVWKYLVMEKKRAQDPDLGTLKDLTEEEELAKDTERKRPLR